MDIIDMTSINIKINNYIYILMIFMKFELKFEY